MADTWNTDTAVAGNGDTWNATGSGEASATSGVTESGDGEHDASGTNGVPDDAFDYKAKAAEAGWAEKVPFDYEEYQRQCGDFADWHATGKVYEWSDEYGDVAPEIPQLEAILFGSDLRVKQGEHIANLMIEVTVEGPERLAPAKKFEDAGLHPVVLDNVVRKMGYGLPTPIQAYTIPAILSDYDVIAIAQTGSGKTAAYLIPVLSKLMGKAKKLCAPRPNPAKSGYNPSIDRVKAEPLVVIVVPTRELAIQIFDETRRLCYRSMLRPCVAYGGLPMKVMVEELGKGCDILIATPGRLCDIMDKPHLLTMSRVKYTVIDEADEMLHDDWQEELAKIMGGGDTNEDADHKYLMFSATFPKGVRQLAREYMAEDHYRLVVGRAGSTHKNVKQEIIYVDRDRKREAVFDLLYSSEPARTLIFCNSKATVEQLDDFLYNRQLPTTSIHSDRNQREREDAIRNFRAGRTPILIATGVSARGWDIAGIKHVINYDLPSNMHGGIDEYVHRIGRTARIGNTGLATSFYNDRDEDLGQALVNVLCESKCEIPDFLSHLAPENPDEIKFDDDTDDEADGEGESGASVMDGGAEAGAFAAESSAWGAAPADKDGADAGGFSADGGAGGFSADGAVGATGDGW